MNLAILIGVTNYTHPVSNLPACQNDISVMAKLLTHTNKFSEILELGADTSSAAVKTQLAQFVSKYKGQGIEELFFYYTGHGDLFKDDFYFLFSDFTETRRNQTALTNEELDSMLKTLSPKLTIKVVDACHAGVAYVKEADALSKQLQTSMGRFSDCYFMFSSQSNQSSMQDDRLSDFTRSFVEACSGFSGKDIRYRDIVDHISDAFVSNPDQTPTFVIQAPCVEIFCTIDETIRQLLIPPASTSPSSSAPIASITLAAAIAQTAKSRSTEYCSKEEVINFITAFGDRAKAMSFTGELKDTYTLSVELSETYKNIPGLKSIGQWVTENGTDFFTRVETQVEEYKEEEKRHLAYLLAYSSPELGGNPRMVTKYRRVITGFNCTAEAPFKSMRLTAYPSFENLPHAVAVIVFVFSKKDFVSFYNFQTVKETDWGKLAPIEEKKWSYISTVMKTDLTASDLTQNLIDRFEGFLLKEVREKLGLAETSPSDETAIPKSAETQSANQSEGGKAD